MGHSEGRYDPLQRLMHQVDLTDAQQSEIKAIIETSRTGTENVRQQLLDSRKAMRSLVTSSDYSIEQGSRTGGSTGKSSSGACCCTHRYHASNAAGTDC